MKNSEYTYTNVNKQCKILIPNVIDALQIILKYNYRL